jgi:hypothetical protein
MMGAKNNNAMSHATVSPAQTKALIITAYKIGDGIVLLRKFQVYLQIFAP